MSLCMSEKADKFGENCKRKSKKYVEFLELVNGLAEARVRHVLDKCTTIDVTFQSHLLLINMKCTKT